MNLDTHLDEAKLAALAEQLREREREKEELNQEARAWRASEERYHQRQQEERRKEWVAFHLSQASRIEEAAVQLALQHRSQAEMLMQERG